MGNSFQGGGTRVVAPHPKALSATQRRQMLWGSIHEQRDVLTKAITRLQDLHADLRWNLLQGPQALVPWFWRHAWRPTLAPWHAFVAGLQAMSHETKEISATSCRIVTELLILLHEARDAGTVILNLYGAMAETQDPKKTLWPTLQRTVTAIYEGIQIMRTALVGYSEEHVFPTTFLLPVPQGTITRCEDLEQALQKTSQHNKKTPKVGIHDEERAP